MPILKEGYKCKRNLKAKKIACHHTLIIRKKGMLNILTMCLSLSSTLEFNNMNSDWKNLKYPEVSLKSS